MASLFESILVPIDFTDNTQKAVNQAIALACPSGATIHLLHVMRANLNWGLTHLFNESRFPLLTKPHAKVFSKLGQWKYAIEEYNSNFAVNAYVAEGAIYRNIQHAARQLMPELIIIGKRNSQRYFSFTNSICPNDLAKSTGYPVLTVMKHRSVTRMKIIVVPVGSFIPTRKIQLVIRLAKTYRAKVHLVTVPSDRDFPETGQNSFLETYRILRDALTTPIEHHILVGKSLPRAVLEYAEFVGADLILVNPGTETKISNITGKHINDILTTSSQLKILSIEPYFNQVSAANRLD